MPMIGGILDLTVVPIVGQSDREGILENPIEPDRAVLIMGFP